MAHQFFAEQKKSMETSIWALTRIMSYIEYLSDTDRDLVIQKVSEGKGQPQKMKETKPRGPRKNKKSHAA